MTITARTVPKFCAHIRAALPEIFFLDLISLVISGTIEPWPECQPEESRPEDSSIYIYIIAACVLRYAFYLERPQSRLWTRSMIFVCAC